MIQTTSKKPASLRRVAGWLALALLASGCSTFHKIVPRKKVDYKQSRETRPLEVPPDLSSSQIKDRLQVPGAEASYRAYQRRQAPAGGAAAAVLPRFPGVHLAHDGATRWLVIDAPAEAVWPKVRAFWLQNGFLLRVDDPKAGILETDWAENRADIPQGPIRRLLSKALDTLYSSATRDRFRVRLERGERPGTTELFLTHQGMEEVVQGTPDEDGSTIWRPRPSDPELEAEMLQRLMVYLGVQAEQARQLAAQKPAAAARAELGRDQGGPLLQVHEGFARAWRRTGIALDRVGFAVEDRNRSRGIYYVRYHPEDTGKKGFLSRLAFWRHRHKAGDRYQVRVIPGDRLTRIRILTDQGEPAPAATAKAILELLLKELR